MTEFNGKLLSVNSSYGYIDDSQINMDESITLIEHMTSDPVSMTHQMQWQTSTVITSRF